MNKDSLVSIIITTRNSGLTLNNLLKSISKQSYKKIETIVVDNNSTDNTSSILKKYKLRYFNKGPERSVQRNYGSVLSKGKLLLFLDSDMILTKRVVEECVLMLKKDQDLGGVIIPEKSFGTGAFAKAKAFERDLNSGQDYFEAARMFPKRVFELYQGYDETLTGPEDWDLPRKIAKKYQIGRIDSYILHNEGRLSLWTLMKKKYYYGLSVSKFLRKQNLPLLSSTTVYFMRVGFYKNWKKILRQPYLSIVMIIMLIGETLAGGLGFLRGKFDNAK